MIFRSIKANEYDQLAEIHIAAFKGFFLSNLGITFLRVYYKFVLKSGLSIVVGAVDEHDKIVGFASGSRIYGPYHSRIILAGVFAFLMEAIKLLITRPVALFRLFKNLKKRPHPNDKGDYSELVSIAVLPDSMGLGIGKGLLDAYEKEAAEEGFEKVALTTDYYKNEDVISFYRKCGYEVYYDFVTYPNRRMYKMIKKLKNKIDQD